MVEVQRNLEELSSVKSSDKKSFEASIIDSFQASSFHKSQHERTSKEQFNSSIHYEGG